MKTTKFIKICSTLFCAFVLAINAKAQNYNNIVNYNLNGTPVNGIKITTN